MIMISQESPAVEKMEEKSSVEFRLTVPDLSTPDRIQDGRQKKYKTRFRFSKMSGKKSTEWEKAIWRMSKGAKSLQHLVFPGGLPSKY